MATTKALLAPLLLAAMMALLASAAVDKPEIKTIDDNINMEVPQGKDIMFQRSVTRSNSVADVLARLAVVESQLDAIPTLDMIASFDAKVDSLRGRLATLIKGNEDQAAGALEVALTASIASASKDAANEGDALLKDIVEKVETSNTNLNQTEKNVLSQADGKISDAADAVDKSLLAMKGKLSKQVAEITKTLSDSSKTTNQKLASLGQSVNKDLGGAISEMETKLKAIDTKVASASSAAADAVKNSAYPQRLIWAGGCRSHGRRDSWMPYCHDGTDFNTLGNHIQLVGDHENSAFRVKKAGYYRINHFYIGQRHWNHMGVWHNNRHIHHGHEYTDGNWHDQFADLTWKMNAGDLFWVQIYGTGHGQWNYHSWSPNGAHSRLEIEYIGILPP